MWGEFPIPIAWGKVREGSWDKLKAMSSYRVENTGKDRHVMGYILDSDKDDRF